MLGLTQNAAVELGQFGIPVNCLFPYAFATPLSQDFHNCCLGANLKRVTLKDKDVANAALFLASDEGRYVSGHNLVIDGGFTIVNPSFQIFQCPDDNQA